MTSGFYYKDGYLYCEGVRVVDVFEKEKTDLFYLYSAAQIRDNYGAYTSAIGDMSAIISYAVKANGNLALLEIMRKMGSWATLISGNEISLALKAGFEPGNLIFNGSGKTMSEIEFALEQGIMMNVDSEFDLAHIQQTAQKEKHSVDVLLRINPGVDPAVHPYLSTGLRQSKFGVQPEAFPRLIDQLKESPTINLIGVHCHLGSMIDQMEVFEQTAQIMVTWFNRFKKEGFPVRFINIGGGLGINYSRENQNFPDQSDYVEAVRKHIPSGATLILEPGRSIMGDAGVLVAKVIGVKHTQEVNFIVTHASMAELLRPSLYQAHHEIAFIEPVDGEMNTFDIVGPVCESGDFMGKGRHLPTPKEGVGLVVFDAGAYGSVMSSNYNARMRPAEYLVDGDRLTLIRRAERLEDHLKLYENLDQSLEGR